MRVRCDALEPAAASCSRRSSYPSCSGFRRTISNMPSGISPASALTITSRSQGFSTRCRMPCSASKWTPVPRRTQPEHMPSAHRRYAEWTPERMQRQARGIGPNTEALIIAVLARRPHPEQGFRTCLGVLRLFRGIDAVRAESVSLRAVEIGALSYASVASILKHRLDRPASPQAADGAPLLHANIRGPRYYH